MRRAPRSTLFPYTTLFRSAEEVTRLRAENKPTIPVLLCDEKKANVFLRDDEPAVAAKLHMKGDRKSTRLNSSHVRISYAVFCLKKKKRLALRRLSARTVLT